MLPSLYIYIWFVFIQTVFARAGRPLFWFPAPPVRASRGDKLNSCPRWTDQHHAWQLHHHLCANVGEWEAALQSTLYCKYKGPFTIFVSFISWILNSTQPTWTYDCSQIWHKCLCFHVTVSVKWKIHHIYIQILNLSCYKLNFSLCIKIFWIIPLELWGVSS